MKKNEAKKNYVGWTESEVKAHIEDMRADGVTEDVIAQFLADVAAAKNPTWNDGDTQRPLSERFGDGADPEDNPLTMDRREWPDALYPARALHADVHKSDKGLYLVVQFEIEDPATGRRKRVSQRYAEGYFDSLFRNLSQYFSDKGIRNLSEALTWAHEIGCYLQKTTRNGWTNYQPLNYTPVQRQNDDVAVIESLF